LAFARFMAARRADTSHGSRHEPEDGENHEANKPDDEDHADGDPASQRIAR
jgi:hypothetical protein